MATYGSFQKCIRISSRIVADVGTRTLPTSVHPNALRQCQWVSLTSTDTRSGSVSKSVPEREWHHWNSRLSSVLSPKENPSGVRASSTVIPNIWVVWCCEGRCCRLRIVRSILWVSVSSLSVEESQGVPGRPRLVTWYHLPSRVCVRVRELGSCQILIGWVAFLV